MEEKKYKRLVTIIIILLLIIVLMLGYIVYDVVTSSNNKLSKNDIVDVPKKDNSLEENNDEENKEKNFDLQKAKQLLENIEYTKFLNVSNEDIDLLKSAIAIGKTESQKATCDSIYNNVSGVQKYDSNYEISFDEITMGCYDSKTHIVTYDNANQTLKKLFGKESTLTKKDVLSYVSTANQYDLYAGYDYIDSVDSFVYLGFRGDGYPMSLDVSGIKSATILNGQLTIEVYAKTLEFDEGKYSITINGNKVTLASDADEQSRKDFINKYSQYMEIHKFIFELEDKNYVLKEYVK